MSGGQQCYWSWMVIMWKCRCRLRSWWRQWPNGLDPWLLSGYPDICFNSSPISLTEETGWTSNLTYGAYCWVIFKTSKIPPSTIQNPLFSPANDPQSFCIPLLRSCFTISISIPHPEALSLGSIGMRFWLRLHSIRYFPIVLPPLWIPVLKICWSEIIRLGTPPEGRVPPEAEEGQFLVSNFHGLTTNRSRIIERRTSFTLTSSVGMRRDQIVLWSWGPEQGWAVKVEEGRWCKPRFQSMAKYIL